MTESHPDEALAGSFDVVYPPSGPLRDGERVQLTGPKGRMNTIWLAAGEHFHSTNGSIAHDELIGAPDGSVITSTTGDSFLALRPLLEDIILSMPRGAAVIYPKDAVQILARADIRPGLRVVEAGVGSGALSLWLLRALAGRGELLSFERRNDFADVAHGNVASYFGGAPDNWQIHLGDLGEQLPRQCQPASVDRIVLDMLAPWECLDAVTEALVPGGVLVCYVATATQLSRTAEAIRATGVYTTPSADETMVRGWHLEGLAVRPEHRMVGHTGFLLTARRLAPNTQTPRQAPRVNKAVGSSADWEAWTPSDPSEWTEHAVGTRTVSDRVLRKRAREAQRAAARAIAAAAIANGETPSAVNTSAMTKSVAGSTSTRPDTMTNAAIQASGESYESTTENGDNQ
ncbi:tRNA (adenine-N1)-methyltransferase [uncultured Gulosibacter sp.]|uniref:tRNA (adenine-N1)-methyltransferase n=1 Tax=uncultured Gulosibacter sp. TaxID=1339167 RepID=UPI00288A8329|nr:tRNA (adenine-N1)-methyltransferase [uncultured Gulosibacter sp.]